METKDYRIVAEAGLRARPATEFIREAEKYHSSVELTYNHKTVNAKSVMGVMSLGIPMDSRITITTNGDDEKEAIDGIGSCLSSQGLISSITVK